MGGKSTIWSIRSTASSIFSRCSGGEISWHMRQLFGTQRLMGCDMRRFIVAVFLPITSASGYASRIP
jgi:hypothetical protein